MSFWWTDLKSRWTKPCRAHAVKHKHMNSTKTNLPHLIASPVCSKITFIWAFCLWPSSHIFNFKFSTYLWFQTLFYLHHFRTTVLFPSLSLRCDQKMSYSYWLALPLTENFQLHTEEAINRKCNWENRQSWTLHDNEKYEIMIIHLHSNNV